MMFAPASIHPNFFALYANFSLNILMNFDSPSEVLPHWLVWESGKMGLLLGC